MGVNTFIPCDILKPYVSSIVISETVEEKIYHVLPGTGVVIGFQYKGALSLLENGKEMRLASSGLTGLHDTYRVFKNSPDIGTVLVHFKETGASAFFKEPIHELFRQSVSLEAFMLRSELLIIEEQLNEADSDLRRVKLIEQFLISRMRQNDSDPIVLTALALIFKSKGTVRIKDLAKQLYISQSPLEKRFRKITGTSPKKFASIVRLKHVIQNYNPGDSLTDAGLESGFYDQAHFIKEFRNFTGTTPEVFFKAK